jgi:hypothetical protein
MGIDLIIPNVATPLTLILTKQNIKINIKTKNISTQGLDEFILSESDIRRRNKTLSFINTELATSGINSSILNVTTSLTEI